MATSNGNASRAANALPAVQNFANHAQGKNIDWHAHQGQRHDGLRPHGVNIRNGVGCGNAAKLEGVVHNRHEKIGGGDQGLRFVQLVNRSIVSGFNAHQQFGRQRHRGGRAKNFTQDTGGNFAATASAMGETGEARA